MRTFVRQAYFSYKGLFMWLNWPAFISSMVLRPGFMVAIFGLTGRFARGEQASEGYIIGMTAFAIPHILMGGILQSFAYERSFGTLGLVFASSGNRLESFLSRGVLHYPNAMMTVIASLVFAVAILGTNFDEANWAAVGTCYVVMGGACTLFGLFLGNFSIAMRDWQISFNITQAAFMALTGAIIPRDTLPPGLYELSGLLPITHGLEGLRAAFQGAGLTAIRDDLAIELLIGVTYAAAGYLLFRSVETYARRSGAYEMTR